MSALPEKGEAKAAMRALTTRVDQVSDRDASGQAEVGRVLVGDGDMTGDGAPSTRLIYGDLFDIGDMMADGGSSMVLMALQSVARGQQPMSVLASILIQGVGLGVLMERARWERGS